MKNGKIKFFNTTKGYGFITEENSTNEIFVHVSGLKYKDARQGDKVSYREEEGKKGLNAVDVTLLN